MSTPLQALERMLLSQEKREQSRVQESLGMMQLAQQAAYQKQQLQMAQQKQDIEIFGTNLELLQKSNETMKIRSAENFLQQTGLSALYAKYKDEEDGLTDAVDELEDDFDLDKQIAGTLVSATWSAFEQNNPNAIINVGSKLHYLDKKDVVPTAYDRKLSNAFTKLGYLQPTSVAQKGDFLKLNRDAINTFKTMRKTLDNEVNLSKEISEFATGDYKIQTEFDVIDESLRKVELEKVTPIKTAISSFDLDDLSSPLPLDKAFQVVKSKKQDIESQLKELNFKKKSLESDFKQYKLLSNRTDLNFSSNIVEQMERAPEMLDLLNQQIKEITDKRNETLKSERDVRKLLSEKEERQRELSTQMTGFRSVPTLGTNPFGR